MAERANPSPLPPPHMHYERAWELSAEPNPQLMHDYFRWLMEDDDRVASAVGSMQWLPPGFNTFLVARDTNPDGTTKQSIQLNLYHANFRGNEGPHGHSRRGHTGWHAMPGTRQEIHRYMVLGEGAERIPGLEVEEYEVYGNNIIDLKDGRRPGYSPVRLGTRLIMKQSEVWVAPLGSQAFDSVEVHHIGFDGPGVAISAHYKGPEESPLLSEINGLVHYKGLSPEEAEEIVRVRQNLLKNSQYPEKQPRLGPTTMMYMGPESAGNVETMPSSTPKHIGEFLIEGAFKTAEYLAKRY